MSAIDDIYLAFANLDLGGITCRNLPEVTLEVAQADLPLRIMVPSTQGEGTFVMIGTLQKVEWAIHDLCLWAPMSGGNEQQYFQPMMDYIKAYLTALKTLLTPTDQSHLTGWTFQVGPRAWGDAQYWAVDATFSVEEYL